MSQPPEKQTNRTGYPIAAGVIIIVSASLLITTNLALIYSYPSDVFWLELPSVAVAIILDILAVLGGALALTRTRLLFAVFGTSIMIPASLGYMALALGVLVHALMGAENLALSVTFILVITISPIALALSALSLIFLAKSKHEFS